MNFARFLVASCLAVAALNAHAHAFLERAEPRVGSQLQAAPVEVKLWFSEPLEAAFSSVTVTDANGRRVDRADAHLDPSGKTLLRVSLQPIGPGAYTVHWRAVSVDTHVSRGDFVFRVGD
ncbi:copper resistance protein CopC [Ramlibacter sp. G-1-2-2]|uniref:Copper resistance protein CopC n=1 Tax=Ramlibacter agri TaxID=2728837 RepID=A0A848H576_9BURK|nr:copper resistance CopC family protein [Ramlibacter agri]NML44669.1 copper resistance protein CopC [Ramlibacter agri]